MTTTQTQTLPASDTPVGEPLAAVACAVCPHPLAAHDTISLRFCSATAALAATTRGCVCPSK
jgi:hypothetical protein